VRWESLVIGVVLLAFGIYLVSSNGYVGHTYLPGLIGLPKPGSSNSSSPFTMFGGYGPGTIVSIAGLGMIGAGLRSPSRNSMGMGAPGMAPGMMAPGMISPQMLAAMMQAQQAGPAAVPVPGAVPPAPKPRCASCGSENSTEAVFCQKCGKSMAAPSSSVGSPPPAH